MRYRQLDAAGDMTFGQGRLNFYVDQPEAVMQAIATRLRLQLGEWFLDITAGTPYETQVLGYGSKPSRDIALRNRIIGTQGVQELVSYSSNVSPDRKLSVNAVVKTIYDTIVMVFTADAAPVTSDDHGNFFFNIEGNPTAVLLF